VWQGFGAWDRRTVPAPRAAHAARAVQIFCGSRADAVRELQLAAALMGRDEVALAIALELRRAGALSEPGFCIALWATVFSSFVAPALFRALGLAASLVDAHPPIPEFGPGILWSTEGDGDAATRPPKQQSSAESSDSPPANGNPALKRGACAALVVAGFAPGSLAPQYGVQIGDWLQAVDDIDVTQMVSGPDGHPAGDGAHRRQQHLGGRTSLFCRR
jgi:hypothetical protein